jgi:hypothetical protein
MRFEASPAPSSGVDSMWSQDLLFVSASNVPQGGYADVYRASTGDRFERCRAGLPEWFDDNIDTYDPDALTDGSYAAFCTTDGRLCSADDCGESWTHLSTLAYSVRHVLIVPD